MKRFFLLLLILPLLMPVLAQEQAATIELDVKGEKKAPVSFTLPVNHTVFWGAVKEDTLRNGKYKIVLNASQTGFVQVLVLDRMVRLFVQQGDHLRVSINEDNADKPVIITGNNHTGQEVFTSMELGYPGNMVGRYRRDSTAALLETHIEADKKVRLNIFKILFDEKKIDKAFMDFMQLNLDYYHASIMSEVISGKYAFTQLSLEHPQYKPSFPADFAALWAKLYKQYPVSYPAALETYGYNSGFNIYAGNYINGYVSWLRNKGKIVPPPVNWATGMKDLFQAVQSNLSPAAAEYMEAGILFTELNREKNYPELLKFTADFKRRYPQSSYTVYLDPLIARANVYTKTISTDFTADQKMIPGYSTISSFGTLMAPFRGKTVFIEFWASWCITCKEQFSYEKELQQFLQSKGVEHLFISVDDQHHDGEWKSMIKYYDLKGNHIRANEALLKHLSGIFWNGKGYALPLYVIIGADGNIREHDALGPSEKKKLYQQVEQYVQ